MKFSILLTLYTICCATDRPNCIHFLIISLHNRKLVTRSLEMVNMKEKIGTDTVWKVCDLDDAGTIFFNYVDGFRKVMRSLYDQVSSRDDQKDYYGRIKEDKYDKYNDKGIDSSSTEGGSQLLETNNSKLKVNNQNNKKKEYKKDDDTKKQDKKDEKTKSNNDISKSNKHQMLLSQNKKYSNDKKESKSKQQNKDKTIKCDKNNTNCFKSGAKNDEKGKYGNYSSIKTQDDDENYDTIDATNITGWKIHTVSNYGTVSLTPDDNNSMCLSVSNNRIYLNGCDGLGEINREQEFLVYFLDKNNEIDKTWAFTDPSIQDSLKKHIYKKLNEVNTNIKSETTFNKEIRKKTQSISKKRTVYDKGPEYDDRKYPRRNKSDKYSSLMPFSEVKDKNLKTSYLSQKRSNTKPIKTAKPSEDDLGPVSSDITKEESTETYKSVFGNKFKSPKVMKKIKDFSKKRSKSVPKPKTADKEMVDEDVPYEEAASVSKKKVKPKKAEKEMVDEDSSYEEAAGVPKKRVKPKKAEKEMVDEDVPYEEASRVPRKRVKPKKAEKEMVDEDAPYEKAASVPKKRDKSKTDDEDDPYEEATRVPKKRVKPKADDEDAPYEEATRVPKKRVKPKVVDEDDPYEEASRIPKKRDKPKTAYEEAPRVLKRKKKGRPEVESSKKVIPKEDVSYEDESSNREGVEGTDDISSDENSTTEKVDKYGSRKKPVIIKHPSKIKKTDISLSRDLDEETDRLKDFYKAEGRRIKEKVKERKRKVNKWFKRRGRLAKELLGLEDDNDDYYPSYFGRSRLQKGESRLLSKDKKKDNKNELLKVLEQNIDKLSKLQKEDEHSAKKEDDKNEEKELLNKFEESLSKLAKSQKETGVTKENKVTKPGSSLFSNDGPPQISNTSSFMQTPLMDNCIDQNGVNRCLSTNDKLGSFGNSNLLTNLL